ncbi:MAG: cytochrome c oxidase assembly protein [Actinomycetota bacterium]|nr:cytochrome c oxidase assembly protein [Actinomycetota bacterium]
MDGSFPAWEPHPDVWLFIGLLSAGYAIAVVRVGPRLAPPGTPVVTRLQLTCFVSGVIALLVASDWPIHDLGEGYLFSVHMLQHLVLSIIAAPLLLLGTPAWLARLILSPVWLLRTVRYLSGFLAATILFNAVVVLTHVPAVVDAALHNGLVHFGIHALLLVSALIVWMPLASPLPEVPRLAPLLQMAFLFLQSVVPTIPASFLTFGEQPLYRFYEDVPRLFGTTAMDDMQIAGLIMKIGAGTALWIIIAIVFFRWYAAEEVGTGSRRTAREFDRELMGLS